MRRPVVGVIGNAYRIENRFATQMVGERNLRAVAEVAADAVVLWVDPEVGAMADALRRADDDPDLVARARVRNRQVAEGFSWDRTAATLHRMLVTLADR